MKIIQPQAFEYTVVLSQLEMDMIVHALAHRAPAEDIADMPHYKRELDGYKGHGERLYSQFLQYVSAETKKTSSLSAFH